MRKYVEDRGSRISDFHLSFKDGRGRIALSVYPSIHPLGSDHKFVCVLITSIINAGLVTFVLRLFIISLSSLGKVIQNTNNNNNNNTNNNTDTNRVIAVVVGGGIKCSPLWLTSAKTLYILIISTRKAS